MKAACAMRFVPADVACGWVGRPELGLRLKHSSTHVVGVGYRGACPHPTKCWLYFPESDCPFYRCTVFSNYAAANCPDQGKALPTLCLADGTPAPPHASLCQGPYWSLMFEIAESPARPVDQSPVDVGGRSLPAVVRDTMQGAVATGLAGAGDEVVSIYYRRIEMGYPTPCLQRRVPRACLPLCSLAGGTQLSHLTDPLACLSAGTRCWPRLFRCSSPGASGSGAASAAGSTRWPTRTTL